MKIIIVLTSVFIFCSCLRHQDNRAEKDELASALSKAENIKNYEDTIFMGFRFGMSQEEVDNHFQSLLDSGKITLDYNNEYRYMFGTSEGNILTKFSTQYYDGKLCEFILRFEEMDKYSLPELIMHYALETFQKKAQNEGYKFYIDSIGGTYQYYYIKNATVVKFSSLVNPYMSYQNAPLCKMKEDSISRKEHENAERTTSDL